MRCRDLLVRGHVSLASVLLASACGFGDAFDRATAYQDGFDTGSTSDGGEGTAAEAEADASAGVATVTGDTVTTSGGGEPSSGEGVSTGDVDGDETTGPAAAPPSIEGFAADPPAVWAVGPVDLSVQLAGDVDEVELRHGGEPVVVLGPGELHHVWEVLSDDDNDEHTWTAIARGPAGEVTRDLVVPVDVPPGGQVQWQKQLPADGEVSYGTAVAAAPDGSTWTTGLLHEDFATRMFVRRFAGGDLAHDWSPTLWTSEPDVLEYSGGVDLAVAPDGDLVVAANVGAYAVRRRYLAKLSPAGELVWDRLGNVGEQAAGLTVDDERVYLTGSRPRPDDTRELVVWSWDLDGLDPWQRAWAGTEPNDDVWSESGAAVTVVQDHVVVVGWERQLGQQDSNNDRSVVLMYTREGAEVGEPWVSPGEHGNDRALDVVTLGDEFCLVGWAGEPRHMLVRCSTDLTPSSMFLSPEASTGRSVSTNRLGELVVAGDMVVSSKGFVLALRPGFAGEHWRREFAPTSQVLSVDCDAWGACSWTGYTIGDSWQSVAGGLTP